MEPVAGDVARLGETAEQLLDFGRHDQVLNTDETVDLVDLARSAVADLAALALGAGDLISFDANVESLQCKGNAASLDRAIRNRIRNAIDYGNGKGMIEVVVPSGGEMIVADDGLGHCPGTPGSCFRTVLPGGSEDPGGGSWGLAL